MLHALVGITLGGLVVFLFGLLMMSLVVATVTALFRGLMRAITSPFR